MYGVEEGSRENGRDNRDERNEREGGLKRRKERISGCGNGSKSIIAATA